MNDKFHILLSQNMGNGSVAILECYGMICSITNVRVAHER
jgi:hypothetical protein